MLGWHEVQRNSKAAFEDVEEPLDRLVRPHGWQNPQPSGLYDLIVVGGGTAGLVSAVGAAGPSAGDRWLDRYAVSDQRDGVRADRASSPLAPHWGGADRLRVVSSVCTSGHSCRPVRPESARPPTR